MVFSTTVKRMENTPPLETRRLLLRKFIPEDDAALLEILQDPEANTFLPWFPLKTLEEARAFLQKRFLAHYQLPCSYHYAVCLKKDSVPIGYVQISDQDSRDLGYGLHKDFWRQGIMTEACQAIVNHLREVGYPYITATHDIQNPRSGAVMKKAGMTYRYSYEERVQPKNTRVAFRMYQLNFTVDPDWIYLKYWNQHPNHWIEESPALF